MKITEIFNYMYYRLASWYFRYEKKRNISYTASILVSLSHAMIFTDIIGIFFLEYYKQPERQLLMNKLKPYYVVLILAIAFINDFRFRNKYDIYHEKWKNLSKSGSILKTV